ncbi:hypothetical protein ABEB36_012477 [Hypothenemus hampei]|uniref:Spermatogenesis-associated protein 13 n=1 Tax=Hypothenemus hampei TaxID=57062 RepID=A0ABD1EFP5_HYPHA
MSRDLDLERVRDRLLQLTENSTSQQRGGMPFNVKRKTGPLGRQSSASASAKFPTRKLSMQDFVRMDPGYTPDIEHLVFPRRRSPQQVAPAVSATDHQQTGSGKTRSRLAEMFALSRHLQRSSISKGQINRSVDSAIEPPSKPISSHARQSSVKNDPSKKWIYSVDGVLHQQQQQQQQSKITTRTSPNESGSRNPNVSILHFRGVSESWDKGPTPAVPFSTSARSHFVNSRCTTTTTNSSSTVPASGPALMKQQSLFGSTTQKWTNSPSFHSGSEVNSPGIFTFTGNCHRELSPVRWCDREVDGVYLGKSGWVQVQQRSLDDRKANYSVNFAKSLQSRRTGLKLANHHYYSEPSKSLDISSRTKSMDVPSPIERPAVLHLSSRVYKAPSPLPDSESPPSVTPIISPPPAFQDKTKSPLKKSRSFFGRTPFLPRANAIEDSDNSPPVSPREKWISTAPNAPILSKPKSIIKTSPGVEKPPRAFKKVPQTKSLEDSTVSRRMQFKHQYGSSSSSSSSMGFRSLDSCLNRSNSVMPRLLENADSTVDICGDADEEDNNSSSANMMVSNPNLLQAEFSRKLSPSGRTNRHYRNQQRRSPAGSDTKPSPASSSSSSNEFLSRSPQHPTVIRRNVQSRPPKPQQEDTLSRVRRSRSLQLPERQMPTFDRGQKLSPQQFNKSMERPQYPLPSDRSPQYERAELREEELLREAEVVAGFLYGNRSKAAAQALLMHNRYNNNNNISLEDKIKGDNKLGLKNDLTVYYVGNNRNDRQRVLLRGATSPSLSSSQTNFENEVKGSCTPQSCSYWPHCTHRETHFAMRSSQSYPSHQRSSESLNTTDSSTRTISTVVEEKETKRRSEMENRMKKSQEFRRISSNRPPATGCSMRRNGSTEIPTVFDRNKVSPRVSGSSSGSDQAWLGTSRISSRRSSRASTPVDERRPGSAPMQDILPINLGHQQKSMSLPKSFLTGSCSEIYLPSQLPWKRQGTESLSSSPGIIRKIPTPEVAHTAPVTPLHEGRRGRPLGSIRGNRATSTPYLAELHRDSSRTFIELCGDNSDDSCEHSLSENLSSEAVSIVPSNESVLQKFRKTISLFSHRKSSKDSFPSDDTASETVASEEDSSPHRLHTTSQKHRFGPLVWRSNNNKEKKRLNKAARNAKCNSGDSGIQIEIPGTCGGGTGESSESHDTDSCLPPLDSPPVLRRPKPSGGRHNLRPHSDIPHHMLTETDVKQQRHRADSQINQQRTTKQVRRTRSDLGGQRLLGWEQRQAARRMLRNMATSRSKRPPDDQQDGVILRKHLHGAPPTRPALRRSLSQPVDIDKITNGAAMTNETNHRVSNNNTSDEDTMSDSDVSSIASLSGHKKSLELPDTDDDMMILAEAVFDHVAIEADELPFRAGDVIEVEDITDREWWWGSNNSKWGWFPAQFVRLRVSQEDTVEDCLAAIASGRPASTQIRRRTSISLLSNDQVRTSVVRELVNTERDFVKVLTDVSEGYLSECRKRTDMFSEEQIATIFINLEDILHFQVGFLSDLEKSIDWEAPHKSLIGECFLRHSCGFKMYSDYCNSHPMATAALQDLYECNSYSKFFEACRLMRGLIEIPLDGYLLTPIQRICKYPLQLAELLKYTRADHEDYFKIKEALEVMRGVATLINERKRVMESLEKLAAWQQRVDGWEGEDLIEMSSQLIRQGEVVKVSTGVWTNNITLFLFDHQVVYCKKDLLKRNNYVYKGRICLDSTEIIDVPDGKDSTVHVNVRNAIKLVNSAKDKCFVFCCRSNKEKQRWLEAFKEERRLSKQENDDGLKLPPPARHLAKMAAHRQKRPPRKFRHGNNKFKHHLGSSMLQLNVTSSNHNSRIGRKMATWFNFKKSRHRDVS